MTRSDSGTGRSVASLLPVGLVPRKRWTWTCSCGHVGQAFDRRGDADSDAFEHAHYSSDGSNEYDHYTQTRFVREGA